MGDHQHHENEIRRLKQKLRVAETNFQETLRLAGEECQMNLATKDSMNEHTVQQLEKRSQENDVTWSMRVDALRAEFDTFIKDKVKFYDTKIQKLTSLLENLQQREGQQEPEFVPKPKPRQRPSRIDDPTGKELYDMVLAERAELATRELFCFSKKAPHFLPFREMKDMCGALEQSFAEFN